jgi:hypothetical protein
MTSGDFNHQFKIQPTCFGAGKGVSAQVYVFLTIFKIDSNGKTSKIIKFT